MGINLQIHKFKENLIAVINNANLPPTIVQMALFEITNQVNVLVKQAIEKEKKSEEESKKDGEKVHKK